MLSFSKPKTQ